MPKAKNPRGRPRTQKQSYCTSLSQAAAQTGIPIETIRKLKQKGAEGFRHSRIYPDELQAWIAANKEEFIESGITGDETDEKKALLLRKLEAEAEHIETKVAILRRDFIPFAEVKELVTSIVTKMKSTIYQFQVRESPALLRGLDADQIRTIQKRRFDNLCEVMKEVPETLEELGVAHLEESG